LPEDHQKIYLEKRIMKKRLKAQDRQQILYEEKILKGE